MGGLTLGWVVKKECVAIATNGFFIYSMAAANKSILSSDGGCIYSFGEKSLNSAE
jgi:hypothetical protein